MATIQTKITLVDGMSPALRKMTRAMNVMLNVFERVSKVGKNHELAKHFQFARDEIAKATSAIDKMSAATRRASSESTKIVNNNRKVKPAIDGNTQSQERYNNSLRKTKGLLTNINTIRNAIGVWAGSRALGGIVNVSDQLTMASARLDLMNDGVHTTAQLQNMIYESAMRSRSGYLDMAASVSKVAMQAGSLFKVNGKQNNAAIVQFMENYNKMAAISGATAQQTSAAMLQIVQALSSGELRGDELRSVLENMPVVADYLAKEMGVARDQILGLGHDGKISAEILRNSVLKATDDLNEKMKKIPYTWAQVWVIFKNAALKAFEPILRGINAILKTERFKRFAEALGNGLVRAAGLARNAFQLLAPVFAGIFDAVAGIYNFIKNNWSFIAPIIWGIVGAFLAYKAALIGIILWQGICAAATTALTIAKVIGCFATHGITAATARWAKIQLGLNSALWACPLTWIILAIIAVIVVIYLVVAAINKWCGTTISATGVIAGAVMGLGAVIYDILAFVWNAVLEVLDGILNRCISVCEWIYNAFNDGFTGWIDGVKNAFWSFINWVLQAVKPLIEAWDKIKGTNYASSLQSSVDSKIAGTKTSNYKKFKRNVLSSNLSLDYYNPSDAYNKGYNWGKDVETSVGNFFSGLNFEKLQGADLTKALANGYDEYGNPATGISNDLAKALNGGFDGSNLKNPALDKISKDTGDIAKNTSKSEEDFSYLRELAERDSINRYTLTDLKIDMTNNNSISNGVDADNMMKRLAKELSRAVLTTAEGVTPW